MNYPKVSVCVPTYNQESEVRDCLDGILKQNFRDYEIIIANDGSSDRTEKVCEEYIKKFPGIIKYIKQPTNKGIIGNTQDCILAAKGEFIAICEGDDYWTDPDKLTQQVLILEKDQNISMVHTKWIDYYTETKQYKEIDNPGENLICENEPGASSFKAIINNKYRGIRFSSVLFRRSIFEKGLQLNPNFFSPEFSTVDIGLFYIMAFYGKIAYLNKPTTVYRLHDGSVSINKNVVKSSKFTLGVLQSNLYFCRQFNAGQDTINFVFRRALQELCPYTMNYQDATMANAIVELSRKYSYRLRIGQRLCIVSAKCNFLRSLMKLILMIK